MIATGETHSIRDLLDVAFSQVGIEDWGAYVRQDERFMRPAEVDHLIGDASKARDVLGWEAQGRLRRARPHDGGGGSRRAAPDHQLMTRAFITGIGGQDGSYLAEQLLADGAEVHALAHVDDTAAVVPGVELHPGDVDAAPTSYAHCCSIWLPTRSTTWPR